MNTVSLVEEVLTEEELQTLDTRCVKDNEVTCLMCGNRANKFQDSAGTHKWNCYFCGSGGLMKNYRWEFKDKMDKGKLPIRVGSVIQTNLGGLAVIDMILGEMIYFHNGGCSGMHSKYLIRNIIKF